MECAPTARDETESCAALDEMLLVPRVDVPSRNVTVPVALPPRAGWIVAESVID